HRDRRPASAPLRRKRAPPTAGRRPDRARALDVLSCRQAVPGACPSAFFVPCSLIARAANLGTPPWLFRGRFHASADLIPRLTPDKVGFRGLRSKVALTGRQPARIARRGAAVQPRVKHGPRARLLAGTDQRDDERVLDELALGVAAADADDLVQHRF